MKRFIPILTTALVFILCFGGISHAAAAVEPADGSLWDTLKPIYDAYAHGHYLWCGAACLVLAVALTRRYAVPKVGWLATEAGSALLVLLGAFGGTVVATMAGDVTPTWDLVSNALKIAFMAAGGFAAVKSLLIKPYLANWASKGPAWMHTPMQLILWAFDRIAPTPAEQAVAALKVVNQPDMDVQVSVSTPAGTAVASSPATIASVPASITVVSSDIAVSRTTTPQK